MTKKTTSARGLGKIIPAPFEPGAEKRQYPRRLVLEQVAITLKPVNPPSNDVITGLMSDISVGGFGTSASDFLQINTNVDVELECDGQLVKIPGRVANCRELPTSGRVIKTDEHTQFGWRMGIEILRNSDEVIKLMEELYTNL